jgi:phosphatidylserine/phosphatidylglycerophosphate/cardiolipin synthase-like enzyme
MLRKYAGVNIRIITSDEKSNQHIVCKLEDNFDLIKVPLKGNYFRNRMHDKFCIIDLEYVMHGSYNWSKNARNNDETLATALDRDFVKKFADEFMRLYNENKQDDLKIKFKSPYSNQF